MLSGRLPFPFFFDFSIRAFSFHPVCGEADWLTA